jgi:hypothetical protein
MRLMTFKRIPIPLIFSFALLAQQPQEIITGLQTPQKVILTPGGSLLVSEPNMAVNSGRVSRVSRAGVRESLLEALPSGIGVEGGGSGPAGLALRDRTLYVSVGGGDNERRGTAAGTSIHNPAGASSTLFTSILTFQFSADVDAISAPFSLTPENQIAISDGFEVDLSNGAGATAKASLLTRFPISEPDRNAIYRFSNLWGLAFTPDGRGLYVNDASNNSVSRVDLATGRWQRLMRFAPTRNPGPVGPPVVDAVPTTVRVYGDQLLISFLTGFPFNRGEARVLAFNPEQRTVEPFINGLTSATDVLWHTKADGTSRFYVLEFSTNQSATPVPPGRLLRFDGPSGEAIVSNLRAPVSLAYDAATGELFILELSGRLLKLQTATR